MICAIWYHLYNLKNILASNLTKSNTPPWVFLTFFNLYKWTNGTNLHKASHLKLDIPRKRNKSRTT